MSTLAYHWGLNVWYPSEWIPNRLKPVLFRSRPPRKSRRYRARPHKRHVRAKQPRKAVQTKMALTTTMPGVPGTATGKTYAIDDIDTSQWTYGPVTGSTDGTRVSQWFKYAAGSDAERPGIITITRTFNAKVNKTFFTYRLTAEAKTVSTLNDKVEEVAYAATHTYEFEGEVADVTFLGRMASTLLAVQGGAADGTTGVIQWAHLTLMNLGSVTLYS